MEAGTEIRTQRSQSGEKRLCSAGKRTRLTSPSPTRKKNSWQSEDGNKEPEQKKDNRKIFTKDLPKVPLASKSTNKSDEPVRPSLTKSAVSESAAPKESEESQRMCQSMANIECLKNTIIKKVKSIPANEKKFRKF